MNASRRTGRRIVPVIMAGGIGARLWPLSRQDKPKQFLSIFGKQSLLQQTVARVLENGNPMRIERMVVVTNRDFAHETMEQLSGFGGIEFDFIFEPAIRNTGPAMAAAAIHVHRSFPGSVMLMLAADHHITERKEFQRLLALAAEAAEEGPIVTFGIRPDRPETGYGYIKFHDNGTELCAVEKFVEKPDRKKAAQWVASGDYLWNSGMFGLSDSTARTAYGQHCPDVFDCVASAYDKATVLENCIYLAEAEYASCRSISIDYAIMENSTNIMVVPASIGWSDVGGWTQIAELAEADPDEFSGKRMQIRSTGNHFHTGEKLAVAIGVDNLVVVDTPDAILVMNRNHGQEIRQVYDTLKAKGSQLVATPFRQMSVRQKAAYNRERIRTWLVEDALPLWHDIGWDRRNGGFIESYDRRGNPNLAQPRRLRVLARQLYAFAQAHMLGWQVNCIPVINNAIKYLGKHGKAPQGGWVHSLSADGAVLDPTVRTYDQAFMLFGLAWAYRATENPDALELINETLAYLDRNLADPRHGGYFDDSSAMLQLQGLETKKLQLEPVGILGGDAGWSGFSDAGTRFTPVPGNIAKSLNPHMHLLEAFLALYKVTGEKRHLERSAAIVGPLKDSALDGKMGALPEMFDITLSPLPNELGQWCEPGHHFEWAHLLLTYGELAGEDMSEQARKLFSFAEAFGISPVTGLAFDRLAPDGTAIEDTSRLWPQLERLRCMLALRKSGMAQFEDKIEMAVQNIFEAYLDPAPAGMWEDRIDSVGKIVSNEIPQSSFYHIVACFTDYLDALGEKEATLA
ncbi:MAG: AGE family epimerase/isomerase [Nitratireductor sp.]|nr:AGE family epimerase/isomerase [Nitratireductor sp.]